MVSFATLKSAIKCREWLKNNGFRAFVQEFYDENGRFYAVVEYWKIFREAEKMFVVYSAAGVPCYQTSDEAEADYVSFCVGGYYAWEIFRESNFLLGSLFPALDC